MAAKRAALANNPVLSTCPLDLALSKRMIDEETHAAAGYFAACRALVFGSPHPRALDLLRVSGAVTIPDTSEAETRYRIACEMLRRRGPLVLDAMEHFVVHERFPHWLILGIGARDRDRVMEGFAVLLDWYRGRHRRHAA